MNPVIRTLIAVFLLLESVSLISAEPSLSSSAARRYNFAIGLYNKQFYAAAVEEFKGFLDEYPASPVSDDALFWYGMSLWKTGDRPAAIRVFEDYAAAYPDGEFLEYVISYTGMLYIEMDQIDTGIQAIEGLLKEYPNNTLVRDALYQSGKKLYNRGESASAIRIFQTLKKMSVDTGFLGRVNYYESLARFRLGEYESARKGFKQVIELSEDTPVLASAYFMMGEIDYAQKDYSSALGWYRRVLEKFPGQETVLPGVYYSLGWTYSRQGRVREAVDNFLALFREYPDNPVTPEAMYYAATLLMDNGDLDTAGKVLEDMIVHYEESQYLPDAFYNLGFLYFKRGDFLTAKNIFLKLYSLSRKTGEFEPESLQMLGECYFKLRDYNKATQYTSLYLDKFGDRSDRALKVRMTRAWSARVREDYDSAFADYRFIEENSTGPILVEAIFRLGELYYNTRDYSRAIQQFTRIIDDFKDTEFLEHSLFARGLAFLKEGRFQDSISDLVSLTQKFPGSGHRDDAFMNIGWARFRQGDYSSAVENFRKVSERSDDYLQALYQIAESYFNEGKYDSAITFYNRVIKQSPDSPLADDASYGLGICYLHKKSFDRGIAILEGFIRKFPESDLVENVRMVLGDHFRSLQQYDSAIYQYSQITVSKKGDRLKEEAYLRLGMVYQEMGKQDRAKGYFDSVISMNGPLRSRAHMLKGMIYREEEDIEKAIVQFRMVVDHQLDETQIPQAVYQLGYLYSNLGQWDEARKYYRMAVESGGKFSADAYVGLGMIDFVQEDYVSARSNFLAAIEKGDPEVASRAQRWLAETYFAVQNYDRAVKEFLKIFILYPESEFSDEALLRIAECYQIKGDYAKSREYYQRVIKEFPGTEKEKEARERIAWLDEVERNLTKQ